MDIFTQLKEIFIGSKTDDKIDDDDDDDDDVDDEIDDHGDEADDKTDDDETDDKQSDITDLPDLGNEESAEQRRNQRGQGLKILTPKQMLSKLPICLAQLKAGNNSVKLKYEIRQLLYSLYCSKKLTKPIYIGLINTI